MATKPKTEVATKTTGEDLTLQSELDRQMMEDSGAGISNDAADNIVPQISVLQPMSPEANPGPGQVEGAAAGDFLLGNKVVKGSTGFWFQPAHFEQLWLEFVPIDRGGGFIAAHPFRGTGAGGIALPPDGAKSAGKNKWLTADGQHELVHYRQLAGVAWINGSGLEFAIPFKSTGHTVAKDWMTTAGRANRFPDGRQRPLFAHLYHLTTEMRQNTSGRWYQIKVGEPVLLGTPKAVEIAGKAQDKVYLIGKALQAAFQTNQKVAAAVQESAETEAM